MPLGYKLPTRGESLQRQVELGSLRIFRDVHEIRLQGQCAQQSILIPLCLFSILIANNIAIGNFISFLFRCNAAFIVSFSCQLHTRPKSPWERTEIEELPPYG